MRSVLYLAWRYLAYHWFKTAILVLSITLIIYIPTGLRVLVLQSGQQLTARATATPLLVGAKGSPLELVLNSLYSGADVPEKMRYAEVDRVEQVDYKDERRLYRAITDRGKIVPRRISGNCARHQAQITRAVKRARVLALIPFESDSY